MNIFASLAVAAALVFPFSSHAQNRPAAAPRAVDFNQAKKNIIVEQSQTLTMMENFKRCQTTQPRDAAAKTKCDSDNQVFMKWLDQQSEFIRLQLRCTNSSSSVDAMKECMKKEIAARPGLVPGAPGAGNQPVRK